MTDTDWITDRLPTEADADKHGQVLTHGETWSGFIKWNEVPAAAPTTIPRLFTNITHADDRYLALADDGTAWENYGQGWMQLDPLPAREVAA